MFAEKVNSIKNSNMSVFAPNLNVTGNVKSEGILEIEGKIKGDIIGNTVTLRESASVEGTILAQVVNVKGKFEGTIKSEKINISGKASINGTLEYMTLSVEDGASIFGDLKRSDKVVNKEIKKEDKEPIKK
jgi:cytoskeletal protein CcmA (bactofilin family)